MRWNTHEYARTNTHSHMHEHILSTSLSIPRLFLKKRGIYSVTSALELLRAQIYFGPRQIISRELCCFFFSKLCPYNYRTKTWWDATLTCASGMEQKVRVINLVHRFQAVKTCSGAVFTISVFFFFNPRGYTYVYRMVTMLSKKVSSANSEKKVRRTIK